MLNFCFVGALLLKLFQMLIMCYEKCGLNRQQTPLLALNTQVTAPANLLEDFPNT